MVGPNSSDPDKPNPDPSGPPAARGAGAAACAPPEAPAQGHGFAAMLIGSIGVVYGDIGTSPLYALKTSLEHARATGVRESEVIAVVSLLVWALVFIVTIKYVVFLMRADNKGEGGILSLMALAQRASGQRGAFVFLAGVAGAALFSGDAIITPAISVLSAVEGLKLPAVRRWFDFSPYILPISAAILVALFAVQNRGTARVAAFFGPIMLVFFATIALLGALHIADAPQILKAVNPLLGLSFLFSHGWSGFTTLGLVFLAVTGAEALYADMGHFGRRPIRVAWIWLVLPALTLNYFGQGAFVIGHPETVQSEDFSPFFQLAPDWAVLPLIVLSALATVIASQAVITGAFSIVRSAIQLGLLPRMEIRHMSATVEGQIYIPRVNSALLIGVLALTALFKTSDSLANAYGIAVTGTMVTTTALAYVVVVRQWRWPVWIAAPVIGAFLTVDLAFLAANFVKILDGGWVPLVLGGAAMAVMWTWARGSALLAEKSRRDSIPLRDFIASMEKSKSVLEARGAAVFLTASPDLTPPALLHNLKHNNVLHRRVVLLNMTTADVPRVDPAARLELRELSPRFVLAVARFGFMESPRAPEVMAQMRRQGEKLEIMTTSFFIGQRTLKASATSEMPEWQDKLFIRLSRLSASPGDFFAIPTDRVVELGAQVAI